MPTLGASVGARFNVLDYGAKGDGTTDDTTAVQNAINAAQTAQGVVYLPRGTYKLTAALSITDHVTIEGDGVYELYGSMGVNREAINIPITSPYVVGAVLLQTATGTDGIDITGTGIVVNLRKFGIRFANRWANTGHGINVNPPALTGKQDIGVVRSRWEHITVYGHDGTHYAFNMVNCIYNSFSHLTSYGGGGFCAVTNSTSGIFGNLYCEHLWVGLICNGTAHGITLGGTYTSVCFVKPQVNIMDENASTGATAPASSPQKMINVVDSLGLTLVCPDFETGVGSSIALPTQAFAMDTGGYLAGMYDYPAPILSAPANANIGGRFLSADMEVYGSGIAPQATQAQAGAGTSPPAPVQTGDQYVGQVTFGTGTSPSAGDQVLVQVANGQGFGNAPNAAPFVIITPINAATALLLPYARTVKLNNGFNSRQIIMGFANAPAASQANTTYGFQYRIFK